MKAEQILYTSCKRGIAGETSGFQTYSYSQKIAEWETSNQLGVLFARFNGSTMPTGLPILPTEEEVQALFPKRYSYRRIEGINSLCGMSLCTYIGRDYPEDSQRSGNFLGHGFVFLESNCEINPGQLIGSPIFMSKIDPALVRKDERPALLQVAELTPSKATDVEAIQNFLCEDYRADVYKQMLACLLNGKDKQYNRIKHIFINDAPENVCLWIASLMMALPLNTALGIGFSTYEFDPENSSYNIVGVMKNTNYSIAKKSSGVDYYFDLIENIIDDTDFSEVNDFCDFVCDSLMYSYENLQAFHEFLSQFSYCAADARITDAHNLSLLVQGVLSFDDYSISNINGLFKFAMEFADKKFNSDLSKIALSYLRKGDISDELFDTLMGFLDSLSADGTISYVSVVREITEICAEHFCNLDFSAFHTIYSRFDKKVKDGLRNSFLSFIEDVEVNAWNKSNDAKKLSFIVWLSAKNSKTAQAFTNKDTFQHFILETLVYSLDRCGNNDAMETILRIFKEYKNVGVDSLTRLYLSIRMILKTSPHIITKSKWVDEFRVMLLTFSEEHKVSALQLLHANGIEDDISHVVNHTADDVNSDFLIFVKLLEQKLPPFFSSHKQNLLDVCFRRARGVSDKYKIFTFAAKSKKFDTSELEQILLNASSDIVTVKIPESQKEFINGFNDYCINLNLDIPQNVVLASLNLHFKDLCRTATKLFSSDKKLAKSVKELMQATFKIDKLKDDEKQKYLTEIAKHIALLSLKSSEYSLQDELFHLDMQTQSFLSCEVFKSACDIVKKSHDYEALIYLVIYNTFSEKNISMYIIDILNKSGISPSSLKKTAEKEKVLKGFEQYYNSFNLRQTEDFKAFFNRLVGTVKPAQGSSILGSVKDGVMGIFKKNKED